VRECNAQVEQVRTAGSDCESAKSLAHAVKVFVTANMCFDLVLLEGFFRMQLLEPD
jgi:hypothetical protein